MVHDCPGGAIVQVRVVPRSGRAGVDGVRDDALLVRLAAAPVEGAANAELVELLARTFGVPRRDVTLVSGARSRGKRIRIEGLDAAAAASVIARLPSRR